MIRFRQTILLDLYFDRKSRWFPEHVKAWKKVEADTLQKLRAITGLEFAQNFIDVYIVDGKGAISDPMIIGGNCDSEAFIRNLTHELVHRILTDNTQHTTFDGRILYGAGAMGVHVVVHAVLMAIWAEMDLIHYIRADMTKCRKVKEYHQAWDIVNREGYMRILENTFA